jgi:hypothetical protein
VLEELIGGFDGMTPGVPISARRKALDQLVRQMAESGFVVRYRRPPSMRETSGHVSASMLAVAPPRSRYVRRWRRHARHCESCAQVFRYMGLPVD